MKFLASLVVAASIVLAPAVNAWAYSETPFVNAKKGETKTAQGWIVRAESNAKPVYLVVVRCGCKSGFTTFYATADDGTVPGSRLGIPVKITATLVEKIEYKAREPYIMLKILKVEPIGVKKGP